jgi:hypothetical protein
MRVNRFAKTLQKQQAAECCESAHFANCGMTANANAPAADQRMQSLSRRTPATLHRQSRAQGIESFR